MNKILRMKLTFAVLMVTLLSFLTVSAQNKSAPPTEIGDDGIPILIKTLPNWETVQTQAVFAGNLADLENSTGKNAALEVITFEGVEAIIAPYEAGKLAIIEFQTPQLAIENDARISAKIAELKENNQIAPIYRKIGNYSVFVFDTKDESAANALIDQVKYDKVVQWLGRNPYLQQQAEREYAMTMGGVILSVINAAGFALLTALGLGSIFGAWMFYYRRKEALNNFSDAGGMMRLNLDDFSVPTKTQKFLNEKVKS